MKNWCSHHCLHNNVLIQAAFQFECFCIVNYGADYTVGTNTRMTMGQKKGMALEDTLRTDSSRNAGS